MRPLEPLAASSAIARLLKGAPANEVRTEVARLGERTLHGAEAAALAFARGALALREGALDAAHTDLTAAAATFEELGQAQARSLSLCEAWLAAIRRGPRAIYAEAIAALDALAVEARGDALVEVVALHYRGTAQRFSGDAIATQRTLLDAFARSEPFLEERAQILNSLGTLYVVLGAFGAAHAMLEHAAELHHQTGDAVGEAIAYGQLGSAALARGELERSRRYLQKQEWFAAKVGDAFGRARALTFLADLALELGRPDDAVTLAETARSVAESVTPPLGIWVAYATRALGRARVELGEPGARADLLRATELFAKIGNLLGDALARWDLAHLAAREGGPDAPTASWFSAAWAFGSLGLTLRVAQLLRDQRRLSASGPTAPHEVVAAVAQGFSHLGVTQELELVYGEAEVLASIAARRTAGQRNLGRLGALAIAAPGLHVAAIAAEAIGHGRSAIPGERAAAALIGAFPGAAVVAWPLSTSVGEVARDLAALRVAFGEDARAVLASAPGARVTGVPFAGEATAELAGVSVAPLVSEALSLVAAELAVRPDVGWSPEAEALALMAGYRVRVR